MVDILNKYKAICVAIFWIFGIILGNILTNSSYIILILGFILAFLIGVFFLWIKKKYISFSFLLMAVFFLAFAYSILYYINNFSKLPFKNDKLTLIGEVNNIDLSSSKKIKQFDLNSEQIIVDNKIFNIKRKFLVKIYNLNKDIELKIGNKIKIEGKINNFVKLNYPGEFDKQLYLNSNGYFAEFTSNFGKNSFNIISDDKNIIFDAIYQLRVQIFNYFDENLSDLSSQLLKALFLSYKKEISNEIKESFINTGTIHVLAVSGLHVGYVYLIFLILFSFANKHLRTILIISGLFLFMFVSGNTPSVQRAVIMLTVYLIAKLTKRDTNIFNALFIAAIIILFIHPFEILNAGFQLSFLAVLSIGIFLPIFNNWIYKLHIKNTIIKFIIIYSALTISAQLLVMPLVILYFHKFSIISLFANLIIVPLIGLIVSSGMVMLFIFFLPKLLIATIAHFIAFLTNVVFLINHFLGNLSFAYIYVNNFTTLNIILYYTIILLFFVKIKNLKKNYYYSTLSIVLIFTIFYNFQPHYCYNIDLFKSKDSIIWILVNNDSNGKKLIYADASQNLDKISQHIVAILKYYNTDKIDYLILSEINSQTIKFVNNLHKKGLNIGKIFIPKVDKNLIGKNIEIISNENHLKIGNDLFILKYDGNKLKIQNNLLEKRIYNNFENKNIIYEKLFL